MVVKDVGYNQIGHYDEVLYEAKKEGERTANKYIFELYTILRDEEHLSPEDCRAKIEEDCMDLWSKATIMKFLPDEAKNPKKSKAGKIGAERKKKLEEGEKSYLKSIEMIEQNTDGTNVTSSRGGARTNLAENDSIDQEKEESRRFHAELKQELGNRSPSPELLEAVKIISEKDRRIEELEGKLLQQENSAGINPELYLPFKLAEEIHDIINMNRAAKISEFEIDFILYHDGSNIIAVEGLSDVNSISKEIGTEQKDGARY